MPGLSVPVYFLFLKIILILIYFYKGIFAVGIMAEQKNPQIAKFELAVLYTLDKKYIHGGDESLLSAPQFSEGLLKKLDISPRDENTNMFLSILEYKANAGIGLQEYLTVAAQHVLDKLTETGFIEKKPKHTYGGTHPMYLITEKGREHMVRVRDNLLERELKIV